MTAIALVAGFFFLVGGVLEAVLGHGVEGAALALLALWLVRFSWRRATR